MKVHDSGYKKLFSNKTIFRQLMESFVNEKWVQEIDFTASETLDKSFVSSHYKETESDLIYKVKFRGQDLYLYILIEFQSTVDHFMALRFINYITNFYMDYVNNNKDIKKLPPVFPILLYNGEEEWTVPVTLSELVESSELLGEFETRFKYFKIVENEFGIEELLQIGNIVSMLFLTEAHYDLELLKQQFLDLFDRETDKKAISLFLNWFYQLARHGRQGIKDYKELEKIYKNKQEVREMLITAIEREKQQLWEKGMEKGIKDVAKNMLMLGMTIEVISKVTGLSEEVIKQLQLSLEQTQRC